MKYVSITGPVDRINQMIEKYISRYDIQLEYTAKQLKSDEGLSPFTGANPYVEALHKSERFLNLLGSQPEIGRVFSGDEAVARVDEAYRVYESRDVTLKQLEQRRDEIRQYIERLNFFTALDVELDLLDSFRHIAHSFGRMPVSNYHQFEKFLYDDSEIIFLQSHSDHDYIWGVYFTPVSMRDKVNSIFSSLHFERIPVTSFFMDEQLKGTPAKIILQLRISLIDINDAIKELTDNIWEGVPGTNAELAAACKRVGELYSAFDVRKYAAVTEHGEYVFVGWTSEKDATEMEINANKDGHKVFARYGETGERPFSDMPPTRLKNPPVIRLFEFFTKMYGLPVYGEIDPTPMMAVTYTLLFGLMFGDVGQGFVLALLGFLLYRSKKMELAGIISVAGVSGMFFGLMYGSVFGFEDDAILPALWRRPSHDINGTLIFAVGVGVSIVFLSMLFNIVNSIRQKNWGSLLFSPNGLAGMAFYGLVLFNAVRVLLYAYTLTGFDIALVFLPLFFVAFREPITKRLEGHRKVVEGGIGMFLFSTILELVEVLLTYATNTISFVRVGAFAISHAGIMSVVLLLSSSAAGTRNPIVIIVGNIVVMGIEGLLVGIQVLRLDFYEVFSRFYNGGGQVFEPYKAK
jgi:V/A-type H+-transporting ATPase subunit I